MSQHVEAAVILYDYAFVNGGAAKVAITTALELRKRGMRTIYFSAVGPIDARLQDAGVEVVCLGQQDIIDDRRRLRAAVRGVWNRQAKRSFLAVLRQLDPKSTIIHCHGWSKALTASVIQAAVKRNFKVMITLHDYFSVCPNGGFYRYQEEKVCTFKPLSVQCLLCNCDKRSYVQKLWRVFRQAVWNQFIRKNKKLVYICISSKIKEKAAPWLRSEKVLNIYNPVEMSEYKIKEIEKNNRIVFVGRLSEEKGAELFCQAFSELYHEGRTQFEAVVVGDGAIYEALKAKYKEIAFTGWQPAEAVQQIMRQSRGLIFPSKWYEGAPLTIVEALSLGLPCVVSDCTSAAELVRDNENGFVFQSGNIEQLKQCMLKLADPVRVRRLNKYIINNFDERPYQVRYYTLKILQTYNDILNNIER